MSTLYDLVNVYEKGTGNWLGQFMSAASTDAWLKRTGRVPDAHLIVQTSPVAGKLPKE